MDSFEYIKKNGRSFWGKPAIDFDALDMDSGYDGSPVRTFDEEGEKGFEADQKRTPEENIAIMKANHAKGEL